MNRRTATAIVAELAMGLATIGLLLAGLSFALRLPAWPTEAVAVVGVPTVLIGALLCAPYLIRGGRGFVLGPDAGEPPKLLVVLLTLGAIAGFALTATSELDLGTTAVAGPYGVSGVTREIRGIGGMSAFFLSITAMWCAACARAPERRSD